MNENGTVENSLTEYVNEIQRNNSVIISINFQRVRNTRGVEKYNTLLKLHNKTSQVI